MNRLVTIGRSDCVISYRRDGDAWTRTDTSLTGRWPTLSPGGDLYALSVVDAEAGRSRLEVRNTETHELVGTPFLSADDGPAMIAPRVPHYASWSPDGSTLSYVAATPDGLALFLAGRESLETPRRVLLGAPLFSSWQADSSAIVIHHGSDVSLVDAANGDVQPVSQDAIGFRAPASALDGSYAYASRVDGRVAVTVVAPGDSRIVAHYDTGLVLGFRPGHQELTVATTTDPNTGVFDRLERLDIATGSRTRLWRSPYVGYWWSPTGDRVVVLVPTQMGDGRYALYCLGPEGAISTATAGFIPSEDTRLALGFFDQYAQSFAPWDATGETFVIAGRLLTDGVSGTFGDPVGDQLLTWSAKPGKALAPIGPGTIAGFATGLA